MAKMKRRDALKTLAGLGLSGTMAANRMLSAAVQEDREPFLGEIGVCTELCNNRILKRHGCAYVEEKVSSFLLPESPDERFREKLTELQESALPVYACKNFLPGSLPCVGVEYDRDAVLRFADTVFRRSADANVRVIVFGSGTSRNIPKGFPEARARAQFTDLLDRLAPLAGEYGVTIALEPLNRKETNFINNLEEGSALVNAVNHPNLKLQVDLYHMHQEGESPQEIIRAGTCIGHCHVAEKTRKVAPVTMKDDFVPFFRALKQVGYRGKLSMEAAWDNLEEQLPAAMDVLRTQIARV